MAPQWPVYRGILGETHIQAVVRTALRANGFLPSVAEARSEATKQLRAGKWLRDEVLPSLMPDDAAAAAYAGLQAADPHVWEAFLRTAGFGYRQAVVLDHLAQPGSPGDDDVLLVGAAFNMAIALLDYLADECSAGKLIFDLVDHALVSALFADPASSEATLGVQRRSANDPRVVVLLALISICTQRAHLLLRSSGNQQAWNRLADRVAAAYAAQLLASSTKAADADQEQLRSALEDKAVLPAQVVFQVAALAAPHHRGNGSAEGLSRAAALGRVIGEIDDLVDLIKDCRAGTPSSLVMRLAGYLAARDRSWACDADLYQVIAAGAHDLVAELRAEGLLRQRRRPAVHSADAELARFATTAVALWSGWEQDTSGGPARKNYSAKPRTASPEACAARMLLRQRNDGYTEAVHHFPMPAPTGSGEAIFPSLLFQRATALDGLIDACAAGLGIPGRVLNEEAMTILQAKHQSMDGGWSYIPEMALLPPDADDLGIVLQVLHRIGGTHLASACDEPVRLALDAAEPSGAVPTWVFGAPARSPGDQPAREYIAAIGRPGEGSQLEVVANFCYGLVVHDRPRYRIPLECAAAYLESVQAAEGHWESAWYAGRYYGTYRTVSVLGVIRPESRALPRARSFLLGQQNLDGGWGKDHSDALSTAFAILALSSSGTQPKERAITRGLDYLLATQQGDGGWPAVVWGAFSTPCGPQAYGSRTITTAFALKALLAVGGPSEPARSAVPGSD